MANVMCRQRPAAEVDPDSIVARSRLTAGVELIGRERPPGEVELGAGHREHVLMCTSGRTHGKGPVRSVLRTADAERVWTTCPRQAITFLPAGLPLQWSWSYASRSTHLLLGAAFLDEVAAQLGDDTSSSAPPLVPVFRVPHPGLARLLGELRDEARHVALGSELVTSSRLTVVAVQLQRLCTAREVSEPHRSPSGPLAVTMETPTGMVHRAIELLHDRLSERVTLVELASTLGCSPWHLARLFKAHTGLPPHRYQLVLRIRRSLPMLTRHPRRPLAYIASELGFADESHFRRHFTRIMGTTPGRYRDAQ